MHASTTKNLATVVRSFSRFYSIRSKIKIEGAGAGAAVAASKKKKKKKPAASTTTEDASLKQYVSAINSTTITSSVAAINSSLYDVVRESVKLGSKPGDGTDWNDRPILFFLGILKELKIVFLRIFVTL